jgi:hypothetical protein
LGNQKVNVVLIGIASVILSACGGNGSGSEEKEPFSGASTTNPGLGRAMIDGQCLTIPSFSGAEAQPGSAVEIAPCGSSSNQTFLYDGSTLSFDGLCVGLRAGDMAPGTSLQLSTCSGEANQQLGSFIFQKIQFTGLKGGITASDNWETRQ